MQRLFDQIDALLASDPAGRHLPAIARRRELAGWDALVDSLAIERPVVAVVTGFCVTAATPAAAETDGLLGSLALAALLSELGAEVRLVSDRFGVPLLEAGCDELGLSRAAIDEMPLAAEFADPTPALWTTRWLRGPTGSRLTHLVAIERAGPSHTRQSLEEQPRDGVPAPIARFEQLVPSDDRDECHNMRGLSIDTVTAPTHLLFEAVASRSRRVTTVGMADGGNELGCGAILWEEIVAALGPEPGARIACRIATDHLLLAGVSDWAAYATCVAIAERRGRRGALAELTCARQGRLLAALVEAGAVDGCTARREASVDGLAPREYLAPLAELRSLVGLSP
ncbi:MAG: glutamate cyclase domain-containing protein [Pirellulales bacterium]